MGSSLKRDLATILFFSSLIPFVVTCFLIYAWLKSFQLQRELEERNRYFQAMNSLKASLAKIEAISDLILNTRELGDFLNSPPSLNVSSANLLYGRVESLRKKAREVLHWEVLDNEGFLIFPIVDKSEKRKVEPGFYLTQQAILLRKTINLDDQNQSLGLVHKRGTLVATVSLKELMVRIPGLKAVTAVPQDGKGLGFKIQLKDEIPIEFSSFGLIGVLALVMVLSLSLGAWLFQFRIIKPLYLLSRDVLKKSALDEKDIDDKKHEFLILKSLIEKHMEVVVEQAAQDGVTKTMQMVAHDIRKPYSLLKTLIRIVDNINDINEFQQKKEAVLDEVNRSLNYVESIMEDVMEVSKPLVLSVSNVEISALVDDCLKDLVRVYPDKELFFRFEINRNLTLLIDAKKTKRVFDNILSNAFEACLNGETIWIKSEVLQNRVHFRVGNTGSIIPKIIQSKVFEPFFTYNKSKGTGLGLAIVKKIVELHGGHVECLTNYNEKITEFIFDLPTASEQTSLHEKHLTYKSSQELLNIIKLSQLSKKGITKNVVEDESSLREGLSELQEVSLKYMKQFQEKINLAIVDDDSTYCEGVLSIISAHTAIQNIFNVSVFSNGEDLLQTKKNFEAVILDIDLGMGVKNGFEILKKMRSMGMYKNSVICIHSNREMSHDMDKASQIGASAFLPKPLSYQDISLIIEKVIQVVQ